MTQILEYIKMALMNITANKGRSALTMLGIVIGISSVILIIAVGNGVRQGINHELNDFGGGLLIIYVDESRKDTTVAFKDEDLDYIEARVPHVKGASMLVEGWGTAEGPKGNADAGVAGGTTDYEMVSNDPIIKGRYFTEGEYYSASRVCIIAESDAKFLFGNTDVTGLSFDLTMNGTTQEITIVGIRRDNPSALINMANGSDQYILVELPATVLAADYGYWLETYTQIGLLADTPADASEVARRTVKLMESKYDVRGENQIMVQSFSDMTSQIDGVLNMITLFISLVGGISLMVGGVGVMNIMLVSVTERTREIGIRKALGARTGSIMTQFLAEAGIITLIGGIIGIAIGCLGAILLCNLLQYTADIKVSTILVATVFSSAVGIFFGIYPARKAAKLSPIEALRHE